MKGEDEISDVTLCPFCGVGCNLRLEIRDGKVIGVKPAGVEPNGNLLCIKGQTIHEWIQHEDRLKYPLVEGEEATWDEALSYVAEKIIEVITHHGPDSLYFLTSSSSSNEDNYLLQKFVRALGTNNIDNCARLCHSPSVEMLSYMLGSAAVSNPLDDLVDSEVIWIMGSNLVETHPVAVKHILEAKRRGSEIIAIDPRSSPTTKIADIHVGIKPGKDLYLLGAVLHVILTEKLYDEEFVFSRLENFEEFSRSIVDYNPKRVAGIAGVPEELIYRLARDFAKAETASIIYCMGLCQHVTGSLNVAAIADLMLVTGKLGKRGSGLYPMRGKSNVQGACDMGGLPNILPGYVKLGTPGVHYLERVWGYTIPPRPGIRESQVFSEIDKGNIKFLYIVGENPAGSHPNSDFVRRMLEKVFLVVQDIFPSETSKFANVVLPAACFAEREGTYTNTERRVQRLRKVIEPPGKALPDWKIISLLAEKIGLSGFSFSGESEIFKEITEAVPQYSGISYETGGFWPGNRRYLFEDGFLTDKGVAKLFSIPMPSNGDNGEEYPFSMITGRVLFHFHSSNQTLRARTLTKRLNKPFAEMSYYDAEELGVSEGDKVLIESPWGSIITEVRVSDKVGLKQVFVPIHFLTANPNTLIPVKLEECSKVPAYKLTRVRIKKIE